MPRESLHRRRLLRRAGAGVVAGAIPLLSGCSGGDSSGDAPEDEPVTSPTRATTPTSTRTATATATPTPVERSLASLPAPGSLHLDHYGFAFTDVATARTA